MAFRLGIRSVAGRSLQARLGPLSGPWQGPGQAADGAVLTMPVPLEAAIVEW